MYTYAKGLGRLRRPPGNPLQDFEYSPKGPQVQAYRQG